MATRTSRQEATGTFTAIVNDTEHFEASKVFVTRDSRLVIVAVDERLGDRIRFIELHLASGITNGDHEFPDPNQQIHALIATANVAPSHYLTERGSVRADFSHEKRRYKGGTTFSAKDLFTSNTIVVIAEFNLYTSTKRR
ncbi:hypothetical protein H0Z09_16965 [Pseudomonas sp. SWRI18]|uniref:hypothetical protein n=1 Tax=Pseudomonas sp. SWRI18 TaxID=2753888 RepID=UPI001644ED49|nr:hypothetical protein [Pseudomonas sp. SWRI18]MBC3302822.1 hypothetical protein [Pseudomonas sp. SWRI18]